MQLLHVNEDKYLIQFPPGVNAQRVRDIVLALKRVADSTNEELKRWDKKVIFYKMATVGQDKEGKKFRTYFIAVEKVRRAPKYSPPSHLVPKEGPYKPEYNRTSETAPLCMPGRHAGAFENSIRPLREVPEGSADTKHLWELKGRKKKTAAHGVLVDA